QLAAFTPWCESAAVIAANLYGQAVATRRQAGEDREYLLCTQSRSRAPWGGVRHRSRFQNLRIERRMPDPRYRPWGRIVLTARNLVVADAKIGRHDPNADVGKASATLHQDSSKSGSNLQ